MSNGSHDSMLEAARLVGQGRLRDATSLLQRRLMDGQTPTAPGGPRTGLGGTLRDLAARLRHPGSGARRSDVDGMPEDRHPDLVLPGGRYLWRTHVGPAGSRDYRIYVPSRPRAAMPLVVMLHGCTQSADDFALGTRMNRHAERHRCLAVYPQQADAANPKRCWNWFRPEDQQRGRGEPALIAAITREAAQEHGAGLDQVYVAGLSAGGAAAAVMAATCPDLYAAVGVHSGLPFGAGADLTSALLAMRQGASGRGSPPSRFVPTIVFHGDADPTVHPANADLIVSQALAAAGRELRAEVEHGRAPAGHAYTRQLHRAQDGRTLVEQWTVHGAGHAWSGGGPGGSYTDAAGPDAAEAMLSFFLAHRRP